jgi:hypothetical protein
MSQIQKRNEATALAMGTFRVPKQVNELMERAQRDAILVSPATSVGAMPEGCGIALTKVVVDVVADEAGNIASNDTYDVGGKRGLSKTVLQKISAALGVSWDPTLSGRLDDGRDPYYCHWRAVGAYRSFDGQVQTITAEKEMDLRHGSAQFEALWDRYKAKKAMHERKGWKPPNEPTGQIREMRLHILAHAESKAQLRAIRSLGIKSAYTLEELSKPFVCARVMFTGQTDDPTLRRVFAEKTADAFLGGMSALYGHGRSTGEYAPGRAGPAPLKLTGAPAVGTVAADDDELVDLGEIGGDDDAPAQTEQPQQERAPAEDAGAAKSGGGQRRAGAYPSLPAGDSKGKPLSEALLKDLQYWSKRLARELAEGTSRNAVKDEALLDAVNLEIGRRDGGGGGDEGGDAQQGLY